MTVNKFVKEWVLTLAIAFFVAFFFRTTIASPRHIPTGSMIPTIKIGEFIFVGMFAYDLHIPFTRKSFYRRHDPERGDIIVFEYPLDPDKDYIKRVIGVPGDVIEVRSKRVIVNGVPIPRRQIKNKSVLKNMGPKYDPDRITLYEETVNDESHYIIHLIGRHMPDTEPTVVPAGCFFVMGDNRDDSQDSRIWGCVPRKKVLGKAGFIWFSFNKYKFPFVRFGRLLNMLH